ncbi:helix-turn-helix domain-containing protein [Umezawaea sp. Da 62-37]|uniref:helix-turn-helix domain-containing protein n=1 Tax=Umezawaea sp. Da 62-37 TaxID=3075927 RepID=UPI0028F7176F|nr:helix-turn-helix domain-containing protein [Umezawaea sp. Da 62-37]WNV83089.1 helix-turn-helix domain-containing protein [Umezawaea sp. Da 62-37]
MSIKTMTWVWDHSPAAGTELLMLLTIADQANDQGKEAWPSIDNLARRTRLNRRTVQRVLHRLTIDGHLLIEEGGGRRRNRYSILMANPVDNHPESVDKSSTPPAERHPRQNATGGTHAAPGAAQPDHPRGGTATPPVTSYPVLTPSSTGSPDPDPGSADDGGGDDAEAEAEAVDLLTALGPRWALTPGQRQRLAPMVAAALATGRPRDALIAYLSANADGVRSAAAVLTTRLSDLPATPPTEPALVEPSPWCGECDGPEPSMRFVSTGDAKVMRCPRCNPRRENRVGDRDLSPEQP